MSNLSGFKTIQGKVTVESDQQGGVLIRGSDFARLVFRIDETGSIQPATGEPNQNELVVEIDLKSPQELVIRVLDGGEDSRMQLHRTAIEADHHGNVTFTTLPRSRKKELTYTINRNPPGEPQEPQKFTRTKRRR